MKSGKILGFLVISNGGIPIYSYYINDEDAEKFTENMQTSLLSMMLSALEKFSKELSEKTFEHLDFGSWRICFKPSSFNDIVYTTITNDLITKEVGQKIIAILEDVFMAEYKEQMLAGLKDNMILNENENLDSEIANLIMGANKELTKKINIKESIKNDWF